MAQPTPETVTFDLDRTALSDYVRYSLLRSPQARRGLVVERVLVFVLGAAVPLTRAMALGTSRALLIGTALALVLVAPVAVFLPRVWRLARAEMMTARQAATSENILGTWTYTLQDDGLAYYHRAGDGVMRWKALDRVEAPSSGVYVFTSKDRAFVIPATAFRGSEAAVVFAHRIAERIEGASKA